MHGYSEQNAVSEQLVRNLIYTAIDCCKPSGAQKLTFDWKQRGVAVSFNISHTSFGVWRLYREDSGGLGYLVGTYSDPDLVRTIISQSVGQLEDRYGLEYVYDREAITVFAPAYKEPAPAKNGLFKRAGQWIKDKFTDGPVPKFPG